MSASTFVDRLIERSLAAAGTVSDSAREAVARHVLDVTGCMIVGRQNPLASALGTDGSPRRSSSSTVRDAVVRDATLAHVDEFDAFHTAAAVLPGASVVPIAWHLGRDVDSSGARLVDAVLAGSEALIACSLAFGGGGLYARGWWPAATFAPVGAAMAAACLLELSPDATRTALAMAGTHVGGLLAPGHYGLGHYASLGQRTALGLDAALLARRGGTADARIFERSAAQALDAAPVLATDDSVMLTASVFKRYPCALPLHAAIAALDALRRLLDAGEAIADICVRLPSAVLNVVTETLHPTGQADAAASAPFVAAAALRGDAAAIATYRSRISIAGGPPVRVIADDELSSRFPSAWGAIVELTTDAGAVLREECSRPPGDPAAPLSHDELVQKYERNVADSAPSAPSADDLLAIAEWKRIGPLGRAAP